MPTQAGGGNTAAEVFLQTVGISTAFIGAGGIASLTLFSVPALKSQPASRSLPSTRWLFSRGSHIFPPLAFASSASYFALAYTALSSRYSSVAGQGIDLTRILSLASNGAQYPMYIVAALLSLSIAPITTLVMLPTNLELVRMCEGKGGARSSEAAAKKGQSGYQPGERSVDDSLAGAGEGDEFSDLSGPMEKTLKDSSGHEDARVRELLEAFGKMNMARAVMLAAGGFVGLLNALGAWE